MKLKRLWQALPWDGEGWSRPGDPALARLCTASAAGWRRRIPSFLRPLSQVVQHGAWPIAAVVGTRRYARLRCFATGRALTILRDCIATGADPIDADLWRAIFDERAPLGQRAAGILLSQLGDRQGHHLLGDKLATAQRLAQAGLDVPRNLLSLPRQGDLSPQTLSAITGPAFVKPRGGFGGRGTFVLLPDSGGHWRVEEQVVDTSALIARLRSSDTELLIQELLRPPQALADLAEGWRPAVLRLTTARHAMGTPPFLHSALLVIPVPKRHPRNFLEGQIFVPVSLKDGRLVAGYRFATPQARIRSLPWNDATIEGREIPGFNLAAEASLAAASAVPALPLINWDIVPTPRGPVILEGNTGGNWLLTNLPARDDLAACSLPPLLVEWLR